MIIRERTSYLISIIGILILSLFNVVFRNIAYSNNIYSDAFFSNDIVNIFIAFILLIACIFYSKYDGISIGINATAVYVVVPLALVYEFSLISIFPVLIIANSLIGIIRNAIEPREHRGEKATIKKEHWLYYLIALIFCGFIIFRSIGVFHIHRVNEMLSQDEITSISDLILAIIWLALISFSIIQSARKQDYLLAIMFNAAVLNIMLVAYMFINSLIGKLQIKIIDLFIVMIFSLIFVIPAIRLIREMKNAIAPCPPGVRRE